MSTTVINSNSWDAEIDSAQSNKHIFVNQQTRELWIQIHQENTFCEWYYSDGMSEPKYIGWTDDCSTYGIIHLNTDKH